MTVLQYPLAVTVLCRVFGIYYHSWADPQATIGSARLVSSQKGSPAEEFEQVWRLVEKIPTQERWYYQRNIDTIHLRVHTQLDLQFVVGLCLACTSWFAAGSASLPGRELVGLRRNSTRECATLKALWPAPSLRVFASASSRLEKRVEHRYDEPRVTDIRLIAYEEEVISVSFSSFDCSLMQ